MVLGRVIRGLQESRQIHGQGMRAVLVLGWGLESLMLACHVHLRVTLQLRVHVQALDHKCRQHQVCQCLQALRGTFRRFQTKVVAVRFLETT